MSGILSKRIALVEEALHRKPDAVVIIDPAELLLGIDTAKKMQVTTLFAKFRMLLARYPKAVLVNTFNMRKLDSRKGRRPDLLSDPRAWLEEVCGSLDLMNRSDVRLGMDFYGSGDDGVRVLNGIWRGEEMHPILIRPVGDSPESLAGFEVAPLERASLIKALTKWQLGYWDKLPKEFRFSEAVNIMGKSNFSRLKARVESLGAVREVGGVYRKLMD
jgi:hypothetical protein